ncbi:MAG: rod shape-determining protein RodA [Desulfuromonadales bacterium]|nr:rod shape-determining protein RodA [Desulfuromonadales bacterium]NIR33156.1 rod shape-determining protein RodA [Desulfuromonadales bacterium]NIS41940.1 rod shape-determining protein RodA [Desulfuromonadales bacterium]
MFDRRLVTNFDWVLLLTVCLLTTVGIFNLYSATSSLEMANPVYLKQVYWFGLGLALALAACVFDYRHLEHLAPVLYGLAIFLLAFVLLFGKTSMGATRWIDLGFFNLQPSEVMKIVMIVILARYFSEHGHFRGHTLTDLLVPFGMLGLPVALVIVQPDLGTSMMLIFIAGTMILFAGLKRTTLAILSIFSVIAASTGWFFLHDYQKERIRTFLDPERDPLGSGYHIIQSKIAVGSGGFFGQGFMKGTQSQLSFLPERHTDFAFSVFAEEWGFAGSFLLLLLYLFLITWGIYIARRSSDRFGTYLAIGVVAMLFWHIIVNLGMVIGLMPVVGVPLPLFSYGGTSMVTTMIGIGLLLNVSMRRFMF